MRIMSWRMIEAVQPAKAVWAGIWRRLRARRAGPIDSTADWHSTVGEVFEPAASTEPPASGPAPGSDPWQVEPLQGPVRWFVDAVRDGLRQAPEQPIEASFGEGASMRLDFVQRAVRIDAAALKALRVQRRLPHLAPGWMPSADAYRHPLDDVAWDIGLACGRAGWFDAPADPWNQPLMDVALARVARHTRLDRHLAVAAALQARPLTPAQLLQNVPIDVPALRRVLQACLLLGLVRWA